MKTATAYHLPSGSTLLVWRSPLSVRKQRYRFRLVAVNGEPVGHGEGYAVARDAHDAGINLAMGAYGHAPSLAISEAVTAAMSIPGVPARVR